jgi:hypothetical protein
MWTARQTLIAEAARKIRCNGTSRNDDSVWAVIDDTARISNERVRAYYHNLSRAAETRLLREVQRRAGRTN